jgi:putative addiction module component (TIGR02574 family)
MAQLPPEIRDMPVPERVHLVEQIWDSIVEDKGQFELTEPQKAELDRRLAAQQADPARGTLWDNAKKRIRGG